MADILPIVYNFYVLDPVRWHIPTKFQVSLTICLSSVIKIQIQNFATVSAFSSALANRSGWSYQRKHNLICINWWDLLSLQYPDCLTRYLLPNERHYPKTNNTADTGFMEKFWIYLFITEERQIVPLTETSKWIGMCHLTRYTFVILNKKQMEF